MHRLRHWARRATREARALAEINACRDEECVLEYEPYVSERQPESGVTALGDFLELSLAS
jgi:hypothetical protein